jgi:trk system potassium uptake protein TrkA
MNAERFVVIGLGHFGAHAASTVFAAGKEVIAIDRDQERVQAMAENASHAVIADATDRAMLKAIGVGDADVAIISLGERMDIITLAALHVKELGVPYIAVKALSEDHGRILEALGVHEVVHPEKDVAVRLANKLSRKDVVDFLPLMPGYSIIEIKTPPEFVGKTLKELSLRNTLNVQLIAIKKDVARRTRFNIMPGADDVLHASDFLVLLGEDRHLDRIREIVKTMPNGKR